MEAGDVVEIQYRVDDVAHSNLFSDYYGGIQVLQHYNPIRRFDYVLIESSGISEPLPVAETFTFRDEATGLALNDVASLHNLVTVVDAASIFEQLNTMDTLVDRGWHEVEGVAVIV